mgnify:FL=1
MTPDPRQWLADGKMTAAQWRAIAVSIFLIAIDGYDVLSISFAAPGIAKDWQIGRAALGVVMSMELLGMAIGSIVIGALADRYGRRPVVLGCLLLITLGMLMAGFAQQIAVLAAWRLMTGLGIGGVVAAANALATEFSNRRHRDLCVAMMAVGYPVGAVIGGSIAVRLLIDHPWTSVFWLGAGLTVTAVPLVLLFVPESVSWLVSRNDARLLPSLNQSLRAMGYPGVEGLPPGPTSPTATGLRPLFIPPLLRPTILLSLAYLFHSLTFYFFLKWLPKLLVDMRSRLVA